MFYKIDVITVFMHIISNLILKALLYLIITKGSLNHLLNFYFGILDLASPCTLKRKCTIMN